MKLFNEKCKVVLKGLSYNKTPEDIAKIHKTTVKNIKKEIKKGTKVEKEHTGNVSIAKQIAKDHVFEKPKYYTNNPKI